MKRTNAIPGCLKRSVGIGTGLTFIYEKDKTDLEFLLVFNTVNAHLSKAMMKKMREDAEKNYKNDLGAMENGL